MSLRPPGRRPWRLAVLAAAASVGGAFEIVDVRPAPVNRTFRSDLVDYVVARLGSGLLPRELGTLFGNCLPNTLDTTVLHSASAPGLVGEQPDSFVITGDIPAMWLRDGMNQVYPYVRLLKIATEAGKKDDDLLRFLFGVAHRSAHSVMIDAYANAFAWWGPRGKTGANTGDQTYKTFEQGGGSVNAMQDLRLFERKFELDSLMSVLKLATGLHDAAPAAAKQYFLADAEFVPAVSTILGVLEGLMSCSRNDYTFARQATEPTDTLSHGIGFPCNDTGMVRTHFRPSDDAVIYDFNVPGNAMAAVELGRAAALLRALDAARARSGVAYPWLKDLGTLPARCEKLEASIRQGIKQYGTMTYHGEVVYAYEVDGFGNAIFMDDANVPSLLSLPFLGFVPEQDPTYQATRRALLSHQNPWFFSGSLGIGGIGGPHVGQGSIWPMSLMIQAWTSSSVEEVARLLRELLLSSQPNSLIHESFNKDTFQTFTRPWFAWANTLFGDLVLRVASDPVLYKAANLSQAVNLTELVRAWQPKEPLFV